MFRQWLCKHKWELLSEKEMESIFANSISVARQNGAQGRVNLPHQLCDGSRKLVQICTCEKCGSIKKFVTVLQ